MPEEQDYSLNEFEKWAKDIGHYPVLPRIEGFKQYKRSQEYADKNGRTRKTSNKT